VRWCLLKIENLVYESFRENVIKDMQVDDMITREQIKYKLGLTDMLVDRLLWYIKKNLCTNGFNKDVMNCNEGFRVEFQKTKKGTTKMFIIKI
jgi:hypothetical protein